MQQRLTRTWITGASGFVGRSLVRAAVAAGHEVVASDVRVEARPRPAGERVEWVEADVRDSAALRLAAHERGIDALIHAAAVTTGPAEKLLETNIAGTANVLERMTESAIPTAVFLSSSAVYGATDPLRALDEDSPLAGRGAYASSKLEGELLCRQKAARNGSTILCCRLGTLYGPDERATSHRARVSIPSRLAAASLKQTPLRVTGLRCRRPYTHVDDAARAVIELVTRPELDETVFNIEGGAALSLAELLEAATRAWPGFVWRDAGDEGGADLVLRPGDERAPLDTSRLKRAIGATRWRSIDEGLASYPR